MEQILKQKSQVYQTYKDFMQKYLDLGHMNEVKEKENDNEAFYLPHHPIIKEKGSTTKLRVIFNASQKQQQIYGSLKGISIVTWGSRQTGFLNEYQSVFQETEVITEKFKLRVNPEHLRVLVLLKRVFSHLCKDVQCELENMVNQDIVTKINLDTDWVHSMVIERKKSGIIQICLDPRKLNEALDTITFNLFGSLVG
ncbi:hypothetical protein LAZ67_10000794 [Cordylochernes scorpioides]|uniref:Uncharacterized protein n=1 Tax=Cordylochernes scorpioides TaxID=51811 RepID=A0ABY6KVB0_9ARAC|nr:hypothetical protein LAZ67_10000794 [Cordylochernes scorpioides]